jgi:lipopolysaccharide export system permease protein
MKLLPRYILHEFMRVFFLCLGGLLSLFFLGRGLVQMADFIFNKSVDFILVVKLLLYSFPFVLMFIIPMSVLISALMTFGKLSSENEILAMRATGVPPLRTLAPLFVFVLALSLFSFILSDRIASMTH